MKDFSRKYYYFPKSQEWKHNKNNEWFQEQISMLNDTSLLTVENIPFGPKYFNKNGNEVDYYGNPIQKYDYSVYNGLTGEYSFVSYQKDM